MKKLSVLAAVALGACASCGPRSPVQDSRITNASFPAEFPQNQVCVYRHVVREWHDLIVEELVKEIVKQGYADETKLRKLLKRDTVQICLVQNPMPCCDKYGRCVGPTVSIDGVPRSARKAGCTNNEFLWVSEFWLFKCSPDWLDEPGCGDMRRAAVLWPLTLTWELGNHIAITWLGLTAEDYNSGEHKFWAPDGPVQLARNTIWGMIDLLGGTYEPR